MDNQPLSPQPPQPPQPELGNQPPQPIEGIVTSHVDSATQPPAAWPPVPQAPENPGYSPQLPNFMHHPDTSVTEPPQQLETPANAKFSQDDQPVAVVKTLSVRGLEYAMMSMTLWLASAAMAIIVLLLINGGTSFNILAFPISLLVVAAPIFGFLFLRLKRAELANPSLRFDPSKRRFSQITQLFTFVASLITMIGIVYSIIAKIGGSFPGDFGKTLLDLFVIFLVSGVLFAYYWHDEHRRA